MADKIRWEYQIAADKWACYNDEIATFLNNPDRDSDKCTYDIDDWTVEFDFNKMRQKNMDSKFERNFRCVIKADNDEYYAWEFMDGRRHQSFPVNVLAVLEKGYAAALDSIDHDDQTIEIVLNGENMTVDFSSNIMTEVKNESIIKFRRQQSHAEVNPGADCGPVPSQSSAPIRERAQRIASTTKPKKRERKSKKDLNTNESKHKEKRKKKVVSEESIDNLLQETPKGRKKDQKDSKWQHWDDEKENTSGSNQDEDGELRLPKKRKFEDELNSTDESDNDLILNHRVFDFS